MTDSRLSVTYIPWRSGEPRTVAVDTVELTKGGFFLLSDKTGAETVKVSPVQLIRVTCRPVEIRR
jgi:hypothetical protein